MIQFLDSILSDQNGNKSSKRLIAFLSFVCLSIAFLISMFYEIKLPVYMWDSMMYIVCVGLGFTALEKFSKK